MRFVASSSWLCFSSLEKKLEFLDCFDTSKKWAVGLTETIHQAPLCTTSNNLTTPAVPRMGLVITSVLASANFVEYLIYSYCPAVASCPGVSPSLVSRKQDSIEGTAGDVHICNLEVQESGREPLNKCLCFFCLFFY